MLLRERVLRGAGQLEREALPWRFGSPGTGPMGGGENLNRFEGVLAGLAVLALAAGGAAAEPVAPAGKSRGSAAKLDTVVVTATRTKKSLFNVPASVEVLDSEELHHRKVVRTVPEALREVPGVMVQKTAHGQGSPFIRGFTGFRTLFMVDGVRLNNSVFRDGPNQYWNTVDPTGLKSMELVKGPSSVLYGSDAVGGTVNALTLDREELPGGSQWERRVFYRFASAEEAHVARGQTSGRIGDLELLVGGVLKDFGDVDSGKDVGKLPKTGYKEWDADVKAVYHLKENMRLVFLHQEVHQDDVWRTHKTVYGLSWKDTTVGSELKRALDQDRSLTYLQFHAEDLGWFVDAVKANVSYHLQEEERYRRRGDNRVDRQGVEVGTLGLWVQAESETSIGHLTYGVEYYHDEVDSYNKKWNADGSFNEDAIQGPVADNSEYTNLGLYLQDEYTFFERLTLTLGIRYNHAEADAGRFEDPETGEADSFDEDWDSFTASGRFLFRVDEGEHWNVFGGVSQGFRAPNLSDLTRLDTARTDEIETAAPGLDPEKFVAMEIGVRARYEKVAGQVAYYYTDIDDLIMRTPTGNVIDGDNEVTKKNAGDGYVNGIEASARYQFHPEWSVLGAATFMDGKVETYPTSDPERVREPIDRRMPLTGYIGLRWDHPDRKYWVEGLWVAANEADDLSTRDKADTQRIPPEEGTPNYAIVNIRSGWEINQWVRLSVAVENLTNEDYRIHGSGQTEPGTNVVFGLDCKF